MKLLKWSVFVGLLACFGIDAWAATEETISKKLPVQSGGTLVVAVEFGAVEITPGSGTEVTVDVWRKVDRGSKKDEAAFLQDRPVEITCDDGNVNVKSQPKSPRKWWNRGRMSTQAKYVITVPAEFNARVGTAGGNVIVERLSGKVEANTAGGSLKFVSVKGDITGNTAGGSVQAEKTEGELSLNTSGGSISVLNGKGSFKGSTSGGSIKIAGFKGAVKAKSTGGSLSLEGMEGAIEGESTGGSITTAVVVANPAPIRLSSTGGGITIKVPEKAALDLDAEATGGGVQTQIPVMVVGKVERSRIKGAMNGGGSAVVLRSVGGSVKVDKL